VPTIKVLDSHLSYSDSGDGAPVVFLHGNPASSHMWRHVLPAIGSGRLLAPDLIGMGSSGKPDIAYLLADHAAYLDAWFDVLGLDEVTLVGHDWGGALAFDWASRHPERVRGIAFFESIVKPLSAADLSPQALERTRTIRSAEGEALVLGTDFFVRTAYTGGVLSPLSEDELAAYLAPFPTPESRRPVLAWARQIPVDGDPAAVGERIEAYDAWLASSPDVPKLLLTFEGSPTLMIDARNAQWCRENIAGLETVHLGSAGHHAAEDRPKEIGVAIDDWLAAHGLR
jgi:haloalkane dehalogenase